MGKADLLERVRQQQYTLPEFMYSLSSLAELYELGLAVNVPLDPQKLYQQILSALRRVVQARGACLLLCQPGRLEFVPGAIQNLQMPYHDLLRAIDRTELERQAQHGPGETLIVLTVRQERIWLVTLSHHGALLGVVALLIGE